MTSNPDFNDVYLSFHFNAGKTVIASVKDTVTMVMFDFIALI